jgi:hypothetical protein
MARSMADKFLLTILGTLNEAQARWYVAREAIALGRGGIKAMEELTHLSKPTILRGIRELKTEDLPPSDRIRRSGGGRKRLEQSDPTAPAFRQADGGSIAWKEFELKGAADRGRIGCSRSGFDKLASQPGRREPTLEDSQSEGRAGEPVFWETRGP